VKDVARGDILVFWRIESGRRYDFIWRVVALPGDEVISIGREIRVNGRPLPQEFLRKDGEQSIFREINGALQYEVAWSDAAPGATLSERSFSVPAEHVFVVGDNRSDARDSRYFGPVPFSTVSGRKL
jgi:signal peptidase I